MMAYTRNGAWTDIATLADLQTSTYRIALRQPRVFALTMFAYGRPSATREHPELRSRHQEIARAKGLFACPGVPAVSLRSDSVRGSRPLRVTLVAEVQNLPSCGDTFTRDFGDGTRAGRRRVLFQPAGVRLAPQAVHDPPLRPCRDVHADVAAQRAALEPPHDRRRTGLTPRTRAPAARLRR